MTLVRLEPVALRSPVKHSSTEPLRSLCNPLIYTMKHSRIIELNQMEEFISIQKVKSFMLYDVSQSLNLQASLEVGYSSERVSEVL